MKEISKLGRYANLFLALQELHVRMEPTLRLLEVGTYDGNRALSLFENWRKLAGPEAEIHYMGFDLWEDMTPERNVEELSKKRLPPQQSNVMRKLTSVEGGANVKLVRGDTRKTLPRFVGQTTAYPPLEPNLIYVDGGHSLETVASDWAAVCQLMTPKTIVLFDDYYLNKPGFGCQELIDGLRTPYVVSLLDPIDTIPDSGLQIRFARVHLEA